MNKLLNIWFALAKVLMGFGVILVLAGALYCAHCAIKAQLDNKIDTISYEFPSSANAAKSNNSGATTTAQYKDKIVKIVKNIGMPDNCTVAILEKLSAVDEADRDDFVNNMEKFYKTAIANATNNLKAQYPNINDVQIKTAFVGYDVYRKEIIPFYFQYYAQQRDKIQSQKDLKTFERNTYIYVFGALILLFILMLIVPILVRIEENTRILPLIPLKKTAPKQNANKDSQTIATETQIIGD